MQVVNGLTGLGHGDGGQSGIQTVGSIVHQVVIHLLRGVVDVLLLGLVGLVAGDHALGGSSGAADGAGLLQQDDLSALVEGFHSSSHASAASANDDHVGGVLDHLSGIVHNFDNLEGFHISASSDQSGLGSGNDGLGGDGSASHGVNNQALVGHDGSGNLLNRGARDGGSFVLSGHGDGLNGVLGHNNGDHDVTHQALGGAFVGTGSHGNGAGRHHHHSQEKRSNLLHDGIPLSKC